MTSKLGAHSLRPTADARRMIEAGSPLVKFVDDFGPAAEFLAINPRLLIVGRRISSYPGDPGRVVTAENLRHLDPVNAARVWMDIQFETYRLNPLVKFWEGVNEPGWEVKENGVIDIVKTIANYEWFGRFEAERVRLLNAIGLKAIIGNFSTGTPDIDDDKLYAWLPMLPALQVSKQHGGMLGLHEYSDGKLSRDVDGAGEGWNTFRYRRVRRLVLEPNNLADLKIVLTEFGVDFKIRDIDYAAELAWADDEMRKDSYLVGATLFTFGSTDPAWDNFNIADTPVMTPLLAHVRAMANEPDPAPTPTSLPTPSPTPAPPQEIPMPIQPGHVEFENFYTWDAQPGVPEAGNTLSIPGNFLFEYVHDPQRRVTWTDIKIGSPTYGLPRTSDAPFVKPEVHGLTQVEAANIPFPLGVTKLLKDFLTWKPLWTLLSVSFNAAIGAKYKVTWPFWPNLLSSDEGGIKIYADDPAAGWARLRVRAGEASLRIEGSPDSSWYNGRDFAFGHWFSPQVVVDVTQPVMTVGLETVSIFGLKDSDFIIAPPVFELVQAAPGGNGGSGEPPPVQIGTVRGLATEAQAAASSAALSLQRVSDATGALIALIG